MAPYDLLFIVIFVVTDDMSKWWGSIWNNIVTDCMSFSKWLAEIDCICNYHCNETHLMGHIPYFALLAAIVAIFSKSLLQCVDWWVCHNLPSWPSTVPLSLHFSLFPSVPPLPLPRPLSLSLSLSLPLSFAPSLFLSIYPSVRPSIYLSTSQTTSLPSSPSLSQTNSGSLSLSQTNSHSCFIWFEPNIAYGYCSILCTAMTYSSSLH